MTRKLDVIEGMAAADQRDLEWLSRKEEDARKEFSAPVWLRWAATVEDKEMSALQLILVNERANLNMFELSGHPDLQWRMIAACGTGRRMRHAWLPMPRRGPKTDEVSKFMVSIYPSANDTEIELLLDGMGKDGLKSLLRAAAVPVDEEKKILKAYEKRRAKD